MQCSSPQYNHIASDNTALETWNLSLKYIAVLGMSSFGLFFMIYRPW